MSDLISRQAAIEVLRNRWLKTRNYDGIGEDIAEECEIYLKTLPSAQPTVDAITVEYIHRRIETLNEYISKWGCSFEHEEMVNAYIHEVSALVRLVNDLRKEE